MKLILHADDFGYDHDSTQATIDLLDKNILSSATIMANMPATEIALNYASKHPEKSWGVHLNYVDGLLPLSKPNEINSLVNEKGLFYDSNLVRKKALFFKLSQKDIVKESLAQINKLKEAGIKVSHLDSHGHLHKFPAFLLALKDISNQTGIKKLRRVQNIFIHKPGISPSTILNYLFSSYLNNNFQTTDFFYMAANSMDKNWSEKVANIIKSERGSQKVIEIGVHPGNSEEWKKQEKEDIIKFHSLIEKEHDIINWNDF